VLGEGAEAGLEGSWIVERGEETAGLVRSKHDARSLGQNLLSLAACRLTDEDNASLFVVPLRNVPILIVTGPPGVGK